MASAANALSEKRSWGPLDALYKSQRSVRRSSESRPDSLDHLFMEGQLACYQGEGPEDPYECLRLEGKRHADANQNVPEKDVHIYDMFWSDLSGVGRSGLRIFGELYQLLFHLGSIGVNNVKAAAAFFKGKDTDPPPARRAAAAWKRFGDAQVASASILAWPIPLVNLIVLALAVGLFSIAALRKLSTGKELIVTAVVLFAAVAAAWGYALMRRGQLRLAAFRFPVIAFVISTAALLFAVLRAWSIDDRWREWIDGSAMVLVLIAAGFGLWAILSAYEKRRPGSKRAFSAIASILLASAIITVVQRPLPPRFIAMVISLRITEVAFSLLLISWVVFSVVMARAFIAGHSAVKATGVCEPSEEDRARRTNWTARLTLALPAVLFHLLTLVAWIGLLTAALPLLPEDPEPFTFGCADPKNLCYVSIYAGPDALRPVRDWAYTALSHAGLVYFPILLTLVCVAIVIAVWALAPSVLTEISSPRTGVPGLDARSQSLGDWLTEGYRFMRWSGRILYVGIAWFPVSVVFLLVIAFFPNTPLQPYIQPYLDLAMPFAKVVGVIVGFAGIGILGLGGRLSKLALGFRPIVRVALDVDNWLREHPRDSNPTARISGRYVSLLRYITQWRSSDNQPYDTVIFFAHSQGTVITADLLRFLHVEAAAAGSYHSYDPTLGWFDGQGHSAHLFTMGCPLAQLYGLRFPYLYGYALTAPNQPPSPDPADLHVKQWVNAYRSGDYIGRFVWHPTDPWQPIDPASISTLIGNNARAEFCIGPGAHTHYWDSTAPPIGETLDILMAKA